MGSLTEDLDRFLKTDGIRILGNRKPVRSRPPVSLTENSVRSPGSADLKSMNKKELEDLYSRLKNLQARLENRLCHIENLMDRIEDRLYGP